MTHYHYYCRKCGRGLTTNSVYGPNCWSRLRGPVAALQASRNPAAARAASLLLAGAYARLPGHGGRVFRTASMSNIGTYLTAPEACTCTAGLYDKLCYHRVAITVLLAA
jgi:hypothetical protein